jgi:hypothetical protein
VCVENASVWYILNNGCIAKLETHFGFTSFPGKKKEKNVERRERRCEFERKREERENP